MKEILQYLIEYNTLSYKQSREVLTDIAKGNFNNSQIASFLTVFMMRTITVEELRGFKDAMQELALNMDFSEFNAIDLCGTGGDGKNTFNISTLTSFVLAGAGAKVAKHGNYGVSSSCGSSNVMEYLGYMFKNDESQLKKEIDKAGICFLHAPLFHPAMKNVAPIRKELAAKTFFNMLGPLINPAQPKNQLLGVFNLEIARLYNYILQESGKNYTIAYSLDGYDEISLTSEFKTISNDSDALTSPEELGFRRLAHSELFGGNTVEEAAKIFMSVLEGEGSEAQNAAVIVNSAYALKILHPQENIEDCLNRAKESLFLGRANSAFEKLIELQR